MGTKRLYVLLLVCKMFIHFNFFYIFTSIFMFRYGNCPSIHFLLVLPLHAHLDSVLFLNKKSKMVRPLKKGGEILKGEFSSCHKQVNRKLKNK